jgi:hypothetical protein
VAVRADDIAPVDLGENSVEIADAELPNHAGGLETLRRGVAMVELHRPWRKSSTAVETRDIPQGVEELAVAPPFPAQLIDPGRTRRGWSSSCETRLVLAPRSGSMTVRTYEIALRNLLEHPLLVHQAHATSCKHEPLRRWITVIEVHLVRQVLDSAVGARPPLQASQELRASALSQLHPEPLPLAVCGVIPDIRWTLVTNRCHSTIIEHPFD